jgi:hypothetical protein
MPLVDLSAAAASDAVLIVLLQRMQSLLRQDQIFFQDNVQRDLLASWHDWLQADLPEFAVI